MAKQPQTSPTHELNRPLLKEIEKWCERHGMSTATFGRIAVNDGKFFDRIKAGGQMWPYTRAKVRRVLDSGTPNYTKARKA